MENKISKRSAFWNWSFNSRAVDGQKSRVKYGKEKRVKKNAFFPIFFLKYQNNINQPVTQCFLSVTNWKQESVLDFVLHVVIIALISMSSPTAHMI